MSKDATESLTYTGAPYSLYTDVKKIAASLTDEQKQQLHNFKLYRDVVNYISAAQIYLQDNYYSVEPLKPEHIKDRLLGHYGTCPGINLVYAHCNYVIKKHDLSMFLVVGPGHGAPAVLANLWVSKELEMFYPDYDHTKNGFGKLVKLFSWPGGFPSHVNAEVPGTIHEGGELGYALAVSYGAVMNNPDLIVTCIIGDGEAETGPTATAWHAHKWLDPKESGAVIPILNLNGYKISSATIFGSMSDEDLYHLFAGYGYKVRIVQDLENADIDMSDAMEWAVTEIKAIQQAARNGTHIYRPRWPMIVMRTPKGWGCPKRDDKGKKLEGSFRSHQVPLKDVKKNPAQLKLLDEWLKSYKVHEHFDENGRPKKYIRDCLPKKSKRMGLNPHTMPKFVPLTLPDMYKYETKVTDENRGVVLNSPTGELGKYLAGVFENNPTRFKIFSPDELDSNKLDKVFDVTQRNFQWKSKRKAHKGGGVLEILSEHTCQGWMQGWVLTGRFGMFPSYEAFLGIIATMMVQYAKFIKVANETNFRNPVPSLNYLETSTLWRQEHNGFSHQNPGFINSVVNMKSHMVRIYLPPDTNTLISTMNHCLKSKNYINLIISTKLPTPNWLSLYEAEDHCRVGASVWKWVSTENGVDPDVVLVGCGNEVTAEVVAAAILLKEYCPVLRVRVVNVTDLMILDLQRNHPHALDVDKFNAIFTSDKPVVFNFHGYPSAVQQLLYGRPNIDRVRILGYIEEGTTTTPFAMLTSNEVSRFHVAIKAIEAAMPNNALLAIDAPAKIAKLKHLLRKHKEYIEEFGKDPQSVEDVINAAKAFKEDFDKKAAK